MTEWKEEKKHFVPRKRVAITPSERRRIVNPGEQPANTSRPENKPQPMPKPEPDSPKKEPPNE